MVVPRSVVLKNGQVLNVREAEPRDATALVDYLEQVAGESSFLTFGPGELSLSEAEEAAFIAGMRASDNQLFLVAVLGGEIVGTLQLAAGQRPRVRHSGELAMSVRRHYWGLGIGSHLLDALIAWAQSTGVITKLNLRVRADHERAIALYRRFGFVEEGRISRELCVDGTYYDLIWMGRSLADRP